MRKTKYQKKRLHKRKMIRGFEIRWDKDRKSLKEILEDDDPTFPIRYWQRTYMSGRRRVAKRQTNSRLRQQYRIAVRKHDADDVETLRQSRYRKAFDWWNVD